MVESSKNKTPISSPKDEPSHSPTHIGKMAIAWKKILPYILAIFFTLIVIVGIVYLCNYIFPIRPSRSCIFNLGGTSALKAFSTGSIQSV